MEEIKTPHQIARLAFAKWQKEIRDNIYLSDADYMHTIHFYFPNLSADIHTELTHFGRCVPNELEDLVQENNLAGNLPRLNAYDAFGNRIDQVVHHPTYVEAGNIIYATKLLERMATRGELLNCLSILFLSSQAGEAGHNCPIACSAGIIRVLQKMTNIPHKEFYLEKLTSPSYQANFTGAQFLTEIQGGSDVGLNATLAEKDKHDVWKINGEKWFCSNAGADLIFLTARVDHEKSGTKGLGLFLVPAKWEGHKNAYIIRRLKDKIGTRSMATGEIDFHGAYAIPVGQLDEGIHLVMDNVLHLSRLFNSFCVLGMARRAYHIARSYAKHRVAFGLPIFNYPLVKENLARIKAENTAMIAAIFATTKFQDQVDCCRTEIKEDKLLLRLLVNMLKYLTARYSVEHIHHALDVLAGNGTIETFSPIPRLLRDCIVCENWEGTHNVLRMQIAKDILKYKIDKIFIDFMEKELAKFTASSYQKTLKEALENCKHLLSQFHQLPLDIQSLEIAHVVDSMALLYCACMLLHEAEHQVKQGSTSKLDCLAYFLMLHLNKKGLSYDKDYLSLISKIIS